MIGVSDNLKKALVDLLIITETVLVLLQPWMPTSIQSLLMYALWGETFVLILAVVLNGEMEVNFSLFLIACIVFVFVLSALNGEANKAAVWGFLEFLVTLFPYFWSKYVRLQEDDIRLLRDCALLKAFYFILLSFTGKATAAYLSEFGVMVSDGSLTLGYSNPNVTGLMIMNVFAVLLSVQRKQRPLMRAGIYFLLLYLFYLSYRTESRIILLCLLFLFALSLLNGVRGFRMLVSYPPVIFIVIFLPVAFLFVFYYLYYSHPDLKFMGGAIFQRIHIYKWVIASWQENVLVGDVGRWHFQNSHNGMLTILGNLGLCGLLLYMLLMNCQLCRYGRMIAENEYASITPFVVLELYFLHACVEAAILTGSVQFAAEVMAICLLCERNRDETGPEEADALEGGIP